MLFCSIDVMIQFRVKEESYRSYLSVLNSFSGSLEARKNRGITRGFQSCEAIDPKHFLLCNRSGQGCTIHDSQQGTGSSSSIRSECTPMNCARIVVANDRLLRFPILQQSC